MSLRETYSNLKYKKSGLIATWIAVSLDLTYGNVKEYRNIAKDPQLYMSIDTLYIYSYVCKSVLDSQLKSHSFIYRQLYITLIMQAHINLRCNFVSRNRNFVVFCFYFFFLLMQQKLIMFEYRTATATATTATTTNAIAKHGPMQFAGRAGQKQKGEKNI